MAITDCRCPQLGCELCGLPDDTREQLQQLQAKVKRLQALEAAVQKYIAFRMGPIDWTVAEEEWQKVVAQASQLAADAEEGGS